MLLAIGMLAGFAGPVAAQDASNSADATVDQDQTNVQVSSQNAEVEGDENTVEQTNTQASSQSQGGEATATADQGISVTVDLGGEEEETG